MSDRVPPESRFDRAVSKGCMAWFVGYALVWFLLITVVLALMYRYDKRFDTLLFAWVACMVVLVIRAIVDARSGRT